MTDVTYQHEVRLTNYTGSATVAPVPAAVREVRASMDVDRVPYAQVEVVLAGDFRTAGDGRSGRRLQVGSTQLDAATGTVLGRLAPEGAGNRCDMYIQSATWDALEGTTTIVGTSYESRMLDKIRQAGTTINTGAANVRALVQWAVDTAWLVPAQRPSLTDLLAANTVAIPAGDRRLQQPEESLWALIEGEVSAAGGRVFADMAGNLYIAARTNPPLAGMLSGPLTGSTIGEPGKLLVTGLKETRARDGWADGVLVKYTYIDGAGAQQTAYQASGAGVNTKGRVVEYHRPPPAVNNANQIASRYTSRGSTFDVTAQLDFNARPGLSLTVDRPGGSLELGMIQSVEWDTTTGLMQLRTEVGVS